MTGVRSEGLPAGAARAPRPVVRRNDHTVLDPPALGEWSPVLGVSVVVPAFGGQEKLDLTLASLAAQGYPSSLTEVVVVDDGSAPALRLPELRPENTRLVPSLPGGWGPGHAVHSGVLASEGEVVLRLDADMVVFRDHLEAQMRWHHLADYLAVLGDTVFEEGPFHDLTPEGVRRMVLAAEWPRRRRENAARPAWIAELLEAVAGPAGAAHRAWEVFTGASFSVRRAFLEEAGGIDPALSLGEDSELGYRLAQRGAVFVPDPEAVGRHLGVPATEHDGPRVLRASRPAKEDRIPLMWSRRQAAWRSWRVPYAQIAVDTRGQGYDGVAAVVDGLLGGAPADIEVVLSGEWSKAGPGRHGMLDDPDLDVRLLKEYYRCEPRVRFCEGGFEPHPDAPFRLLVPAGFPVAPHALAVMAGIADRERAGLVLTRGGGPRLERTSAFARARLLGASPEDLDAVVADVWGTAEAERDAVAATGEAPEPPPSDWDRRLKKALRKAERAEEEADRWERRIRALTRGRWTGLTLWGTR
ncbi:glycosyltransferase [Nocardiopsis changdeensis]|uniref:glycosyltransferase n=1 Tax=Nocardiopsis TaxID=2013 RepID=UPI0021031D32|nr:MULTISPECIES: glycosyltransferase family 2 protein [Nocardiopsis]